MIAINSDSLHCSGWSDSCVRLHTPETGKLVEEVRTPDNEAIERDNVEVRNAATGSQGVTSMGVGGELMVVGGADGGVRLWSLPRYSHPKMGKSVRSDYIRGCGD